MPSFCCIIGCSSNALRDNISFFRIPKVIGTRTDKIYGLTLDRREKWLQAIKRADFPEQTQRYARVCARHFISGRPADLFDNSDPDWAPNLALGYEDLGDTIYVNTVSALEGMEGPQQKMPRITMYPTYRKICDVTTGHVAMMPSSQQSAEPASLPKFLTATKDQFTWVNVQTEEEQISTQTRFSTKVGDQIDSSNVQTKQEDISLECVESSNTEKNCSNVQIKEEGVPIEFVESSNAETNANQEIQPTQEDPLNQEFDVNTCVTTTAELISTEPDVLDDIKVEVCEDPLDIQEQNVSQCSDPLENTSKEKSEGDFVDLAQVKNCPKLAKPRKRRKQLLLPAKRKIVELPQTKPANFGVDIQQLNGLNSSPLNFEVIAQPTVIEEDGFSQKVVLEVKVKPRNQQKTVTDSSEGARNHLRELSERIQRFLEKDIRKSSRLKCLQKIITAQNKKIEELTEIVNDIMGRPNLEHDTGP